MIPDCNFLRWISLVALLLASCDPRKPSTTSSAVAEGRPDQNVSILTISKGDRWTYDVLLRIPADVTSPGAAEVESSHQKTRTYLGKLAPAAGLPEVDCFEVVSPNAPVEREFVEIHHDRILMRGSMIMRPETTRPMWLDHPVPWFIAGMRPGTDLPEIATPGGGLTRKTQVVAHEEITVPAGTFSTTRLLITGNDGEFNLHRTLWFAPGTGIIREEKIRHLRDRVIFRETQELVETGKQGH